MARPNADVVDETSEYAGRIAGYADRTADAAKEAAVEATERLTNFARDALNDPEKVATDTYKSVARYAQDKPLHALAITAGVAFVIGALWKK